jgi:hypothetical protein
MRAYREALLQRARLALLAVALGLAIGVIDAATAECCDTDPAITHGLDEGFGAPPLDGQASASLQPRLVYLLSRLPSAGGPPLIGFKAWLDGDVCPLRVPENLDDESKMDASHAKEVVLGTVSRRDGRVKIELTASKLSDGAVRGPVTGEAEGEDKAAVAAATHQALKALDLICEG